MSSRCWSARLSTGSDGTGGDAGLAVYGTPVPDSAGQTATDEELMEMALKAAEERWTKGGGSSEA
jgi:hypothetical protein